MDAHKHTRESGYLQDRWHYPRILKAGGGGKKVTSAPHHHRCRHHHRHLTCFAMCGSSWREELLLPGLSTVGVNNVWSQKHSAAAGLPQYSKHIDSDG